MADSAHLAISSPSPAADTVSLRRLVCVAAYLGMWYVLAIAFAVFWGLFGRSGEAEAGWLARTLSTAMATGTESAGSRMCAILGGILILGAIGSVITATMRVTSQPSALATPQGVLRHLFAPFIGMMLAGFFFVALRSGSLVFSGGGTATAKITNANLYFLAAIMAGLFSEATYGRLKDVSEKVFSIKTHGVAHAPAEASIPAAAVTETETGSNRRAADRRDPTAVVMEARSAADRETAFSLWYDVFVRRQRWCIASRDDEAHTVRDGYDRISRILISKAEHDEAVLGAVRTVLWRELEPEMQIDRGGVPATLASLRDPQDSTWSFQLPRGVPSKKCSWSGYFVPDHTSKLAFTRPGRALASRLYELLSQEGILVDWIVCGDLDVRLYERLGYRTYKRGLWYPLSQRTVTLMFMVVPDLEHMAQTAGRYLSLPANDLSDSDRRLVRRTLKALDQSNATAKKEAPGETPEPCRTAAARRNGSTNGRVATVAR